MKKLLILVGALSVAVFAQAQSLTTLTAADGSTYAIKSASFTTNPTTTSSASIHSVDFTPFGGTDYAFRNLFAFRQTGDTREWWMTSASATFSNTADSFTASVNRAVNNTGTNTINFLVKHQITSSLGVGTPMVITTVTATNLDPLVSRGVTLFNYLDFDIPGGGADAIVSNSIHPSGLAARQGDIIATGNYADMWAEGANRYRHGTLITTNWTNTTIDDLPNTITAGSGDFGLTFQWGERMLAPGASTTFTIYQRLNAPVPEPASMTAIAIGLAAIARRKKNS